MTANRIIAHVFLQPSLQLVNEAAMEQLVADHPYFSAARLLLARKAYQQTGNLQHPAVRKALLYADQQHYAYQLITEEQVLQVVENRVAAVIPEDTLPAEDTHHVPEAIAPETENLALEVENTATETATIDLEAMIATPETEATPIAVADFEPEAAGPIKIFPMAKAAEETELIFQPLFTDDYFAYKRLKNPDEADALNEQGAAEMKSFTSWLRQMKDNFAGKTNKDWYHQQLHRIYEEDEEPEVSETVEKMAMDSIVFNNDIVSETLAEIWVRQQQYGNAIKIYQKLSLLNPDKNAYFAQKILELKSKTDKNK